MQIEKAIHRILIVQELLNDSKQHIYDRVVQCEAILETMPVDPFPKPEQLQLFHDLAAKLKEAHSQCRAEDWLGAAICANEALTCTNDLLSLLSPHV